MDFVADLGFGAIGLVFFVVQVAILLYVLSLIARGVAALERMSDVLDRRLAALDTSPPPDRIEWPDEG